MRIASFGLLLVVVACAQPQPERVFVPGKPFTHVIDVRTAQGLEGWVRVGE